VKTWDLTGWKKLVISVTHNEVKASRVLMNPPLTAVQSPAICVMPTPPEIMNPMRACVCVCVCVCSDDIGDALLFPDARLQPNVRRDEYGRWHRKDWRENMSPVTEVSSCQRNCYCAWGQKQTVPEMLCCLQYHMVDNNPKVQQSRILSVTCGFSARTRAVWIWLLVYFVLLVATRHRQELCGSGFWYTLPYLWLLGTDKSCVDLAFGILCPTCGFSARTRAVWIWLLVYFALLVASS
jgi:hypothetical protein